MKTPALAITATAATALSALQPLSPSAFCSDAPPPRPNIIFILCDDLGYGDIGAFFQNARHAADPAAPCELTPNLDRMAAQGARLTHHYCAAPVCVSSRSSLLTGLSQGHANVRDSQFDKAIADNHTLATVLRQAGYATAAIGKWGLHGDEKSLNKKPETAADLDRTDWPAFPLNRGFDFFLGFLRHVDGHDHYYKEAPHFAKTEGKTRGPIYVWENHANITATLDKCYSADLFTARAKQWIIDHVAQTAKSADAAQPRPIQNPKSKIENPQPFFLYLAYDTPHIALELPTQPYPPGGGLHGGLQWLGKPGRMINTATGKIDSWTHPDYANATYTDNTAPGSPKKPWPDNAKRYATAVRRLDDALADLLQLLKDLHIDDNTIVIFTSDNGPEDVRSGKNTVTQFFASFAHFDGVKRDVLEGGLRVPAIARWPGRIPAATEIAAPCIMYDWLPTFAELAGLPPPANADGRSLLGNLLARPTPASRGAADPADYLYTEYHIGSKTPNYSEFEPARRNRTRNQMQALRQGDLMALRYNTKTQQDDFEIYNVATDPKETRNLAQTPEGPALQTHFKTLALQSRRPDPPAPRPYDNELVPAIPADAAQTAKPAPAPGLTYRYYETACPWVPNTATLTPTATGHAAAPDLAATPLSAAPPAAGAAAPTVNRKLKTINSAPAVLVYEGTLQVPADGDYTFTLATDTGALLRLHAATLIDADYGYKPGQTRAATIRLAAGPHPITLTYRTDATRAPQLDLRWSGPGLAAQKIPPDAFRAAP